MKPLQQLLPVVYWHVVCATGSRCPDGPMSPDPTWKLAVEQVNGKVTTDIGKSAVNEEVQNCDCDNAIRYDVSGKPYAYYHRLNDVSSWDMYGMLTGCWKSENNKANADFWMFSTEAELLKGDWHPAWRSCDCECDTFSTCACLFHYR
eukprot:SAG31_NODE_6253_length_2102_cov_1.213180_1_plen_148_part_00